jgi:hypothetical protein
MHADPQRRYATVDAFMRDIDHYVKGEPLEARPDAFGYRLSKFPTAGAAVAITKNGMDKSFREIELVAPFLGVPTLGAIESIETADELARRATGERRRTTVLVALGLIASAGLVLALTGAGAAIEGLIPGLGG